MNIARRIKKSRIKRKQRRGKPGGNRNPRHVFNRHEPWGRPKWNKRRRKETNIGRRRSAPKSEESLRKVAPIPSNEMRHIDVVLRGTTYIASSLVVGMVYLLAVIGLTFCMPPAIFVVVDYIFGLSIFRTTTSSLAGGTGAGPVRIRVVKQRRTLRMHARRPSRRELLLSLRRTLRGWLPISI